MKDFVELKDFPGYYIAHSPARLMRLKGDVYVTCKQTPNSKKDSYWSVTLKTREGKYVKRHMHRLLMQTFVSNPYDKAHVNHIDGDKSNNDMDNLEWATPKENSIHAYETGLSSCDWKKKQVHQYYLDGEFVASFNCDDDAESKTGIAKQNISKVTLGKRKHAGFYQWSRELKPSLKPLNKKYIRSYSYQGKGFNILFNSIKEIAEYFGLSNGDKLPFSKIPKSIRNDISINYYK